MRDAILVLGALVVLYFAALTARLEYGVWRARRDLRERGWIV